jgi:hypothetical protein
MYVDVVLFRKGRDVEMARLGALPIDEIELLELAIGNPALESHQGNTGFGSGFARPGPPNPTQAFMVFGQ